MTTKKDWTVWADTINPEEMPTLDQKKWAAEFVMSRPPSIEVRVKDVYGNQMIYPVCDAAKVFAAIAGTKTLTQQTLLLIKQLGYDINIAPQSIC
jgi:hypothetical protein